VDMLRIRGLNWIFSVFFGYEMIALALYCMISYSRGMELLQEHCLVGTTASACMVGGQ
jgi:NADH:ubiquinone oxidoreductase subunit 2 (subunit N)